MTTENISQANEALFAGLRTDGYINGAWVQAPEDKRFEVLNPATGEVLTTVANLGSDDAMAAMDAADAAQAAWGKSAPRERADLLRAAFDGLIARREEFARLISLEMGKPLAEARGEVTYAAEFLRWFSEEATRISGRYGSNAEGTGRVIVSQRPVGPCLLITPWNFPLAMATRKIGPALAAGCTSIIKPAAQTPLTTLAFTSMLDEIGVPAGVVNVVPTTSASSISEPLLADPRLRKMSFTGSTAVGRSLLKLAADQVLRTSMELGGNAPFLVFEDADLDAAVQGSLLAKFRNIGQACTAANRFLVHSSVAEDFSARMTKAVEGMKIGSGLEDGVTIGPLVDEAAVSKVSELVEDALAGGATLHTGGAAIDGPGHFFQPTVLSSVTPAAKMWTSEIFGPVLAITTFDTEEEAVAAANDTEYGLIAYAYTKDLKRSQRLIEDIESGMLGLNMGVVSNAAAPFGGVKQSGLGREGGPEGISEYLTTRYALTPAP